MNLPESLKNDIVELLRPLEPESVILFGSYAYGQPTEESDIDIFIVTDVPEEAIHRTSLEAMKLLRRIVREKRKGIDVFVDSRARINYRIQTIKDQFYEEIFKNGVELRDTQ